MKTYWWVPENTLIGWSVTSISTAIPLDSPKIVDFDIRGVAGPDGSLNIFGYAEDGSYLNYYWYPGFGADWRVENLSEVGRGSVRLVDRASGPEGDHPEADLSASCDPTPGGTRGTPGPRRNVLPSSPCHAASGCPCSSGRTSARA